MPTKYETSKAELAMSAVPPENMTPRQAAAYLNIPETTLAVWRSTNRVVAPPFFKMGHHVRYRRSDLEQFIERCMRNQTA